MLSMLIIQSFLSKHGLLLAAGSAFLFSLSSLTVKLVPEIPPGEICFACYTLLFLVSFPLTLYLGEPLWPKGHIIKLVVRSLTAAPVLLTSYQAVRLMPLGDEAVLAYTSIVFTIILARLFIREKCGWSKLVATFMIITGVGMLTQPFIGSHDQYPRYLLGAGISLFGALSDATASILLKGIKVHSSVVLTYFSGACMILSAPFAAFETWVVPRYPVFIIAVITMFQECLATLAIRVEQAGLVALVHASDIVFSYVWELCFFQESYTVVRVLGALMIGSTVILIAVVRERQDDEELPVNGRGTSVVDGGSTSSNEPIKVLSV